MADTNRGLFPQRIETAATAVGKHISRVNTVVQLSVWHELGVLLGICAIFIGLFMLLGKCHNISIVVISKIIKAISLFGILFSLLEWEYNEGRGINSNNRFDDNGIDKQESSRIELSSLSRATTFLTMVVLAILVWCISEEFLREVPTCVDRTGADFLEKVWFIIISMITTLPPFVMLGVMNIRIMMIKSAEESAGAAKYLYYVDVPCVISSICVFVLASATMPFFDTLEITDFLSGSMAFLVFVAFVTETVIKYGGLRVGADRVALGTVRQPNQTPRPWYQRQG